MRRLRSERGSATVEFTLVATLLVLVVVSVMQLSLGLYVRNVVVDACGEGARYGALLGGDGEAGAERTRELITSAVSSEYAGDVTVRYETINGLDTVVVTARTPIPVIGLLGIAEISAEGHGVLETLV
ncbi:TadE/TadG family type IV pilus assembly protein [uncultured Agrococcus sp.]|uniref:TadE/TadG family type IV pilus assembly protein n=1 Tax=uncultured Agrococcus sp. TaxID=382258 RepID=UPI0025DD86EC|nr:TadE/TadG family type IV pilus assembly protein [uncultured Agrococcus sp.]